MSPQVVSFLFMIQTFCVSKILQMQPFDCLQSVWITFIGLEWPGTLKSDCGNVHSGRELRLPFHTIQGKQKTTLAFGTH